MQCQKILTILVISAAVIASQALGQNSRLEQIERKKAVKAASVSPEQRETGDRIITKAQRFFMPEPPAVRLTFGNFRPGAGLAAGLAYSTPVGRALWTTTTAWSIKNFKQIETALALAPVAGNRVQISPFVKWNDAPDLPYFGLGNSTARGDETSYALRVVDAGVALQSHAGRRIQFGGGIGYFGVHSADGKGPDPDIGKIFSNTGAPGLGSRPTWMHSKVFVAFDSRESPGYTQSGALYRVTYHRYFDHNDQFTFNWTEVDLRQFIPLLHRNWVIALQGLADLTAPSKGQEVPYYLLPTVGGRETLTGFSQYRFSDRDSLLLRSELRWAASPLVDMALIFDQGKVASRLAGLDLTGLKRSVGIGMRLHGPKFTALRIEIARSNEGWRLNLAHGFSF